MSADAPATKRPLRDTLRLGLKALSVLIVCAIATFAIYWFIPESGDYARAVVIKHERLTSIEGEKVVLVGGSNLAYGIDSPLIEGATSCPVVNMGMNGYFGVRYMLEEVRPHVNAGDTIVVALETDSFFKPVEGTSSNLLLVVKELPEAFGYLTWQQQFGLASAMPYVAQQKILRLIRSAAFGLRDALLGPDEDPPGRSDLMIAIETADGFTPNGDLVSHLDVDWQMSRDQGEPADTPIDPGLIPLLQQYQGEMAARGVRVMMSYTPLERSFYEQYQVGLDGVEQAMRDAGLNVVSSVGDYVYDESFFFDTVFHLNAEGRALRSARLAADINAFRDAPCAPGSQTRVTQ